MITWGWKGDIPPNPTAVGLAERRTIQAIIPGSWFLPQLSHSYVLKGDEVEVRRSSIPSHWHGLQRPFEPIPPLGFASSFLPHDIFDASHSPRNVWSPIGGETSFSFYLDEELQCLCLSLSSYLDRETPVLQ